MSVMDTWYQLCGWREFILKTLVSRRINIQHNLYVTCSRITVLDNRLSCERNYSIILFILRITNEKYYNFIYLRCKFKNIHDYNM